MGSSDSSLGSGGSLSTGSSPSSGGSPSTGGDGLGGDGLGGVENEPAVWVFSQATLVQELSNPSKDENPTLSADRLSLCFTSKREGGKGDVDVWCTARSDTNEPFREPWPIEELNTEDFESSTALSRDGLTLWFGSEREGGVGGVDIWMSERPSPDQSFGAPRLVDELNTAFDDIPRPPGGPYDEMPLSTRIDDGPYLTLLSRLRPDGTFSPPELVANLADEDQSAVDAHLSEDGLALLFNRAPDGEDPGNLYLATRSSADGTFGRPTMLEGVNSEADDRDPWLSRDGKLLYFASDRSGDFEIYVASRIE